MIFGYQLRWRNFWIKVLETVLFLFTSFFKLYILSVVSSYPNPKQKVLTWNHGCLHVFQDNIVKQLKALLIDWIERRTEIPHKFLPDCHIIWKLKELETLGSLLKVIVNSDITEMFFSATAVTLDVNMNGIVSDIFSYSSSGLKSWSCRIELILES